MRFIVFLCFNRPALGHGFFTRGKLGKQKLRTHLVKEIPLPTDEFQGNSSSKNALISCLVRQPLFPLTNERKEKKWWKLCYTHPKSGWKCTLHQGIRCGLCLVFRFDSDGSIGFNDGLGLSKWYYSNCTKSFFGAKEHGVINILLLVTLDLITEWKNDTFGWSVDVGNSPKHVNLSCYLLCVIFYVIVCQPRDVLLLHCAYKW